MISLCPLFGENFRWVGGRWEVKSPRCWFGGCQSSPWNFMVIQVVKSIGLTLIFCKLQCVNSRALTIKPLNRECFLVILHKTIRTAPTRGTKSFRSPLRIVKWNAREDFVPGLKQLLFPSSLIHISDLIYRFMSPDEVPSLGPGRTFRLPFCTFLVIDIDVFFDIQYFHFTRIHLVSWALKESWVHAACEGTLNNTSTPRVQSVACSLKWEMP